MQREKCQTIYKAPVEHGTIRTYLYTKRNKSKHRDVHQDSAEKEEATKCISSTARLATSVVAACPNIMMWRLVC